MHYVAVTACPTGIAHTYMAAEKLQQTAQGLGHTIKVETQGSIGAENVLTATDIAAADAVIIAADKDVDLARFAGKRVLRAPVADGIHKGPELLERALEAPIQAGAIAAGGGEEDQGQTAAFYRTLMGGVSPMIPFAVVGGFLLALATTFGGGQDAAGTLSIPEGTFWWKLQQISDIAFALMIPILSGFIAMAIADRPGLAPGMIAGVVANTGDLFGADAGGGFFGAIVAGFVAGYLALWIKQVRVPKVVQAIMPIIVIPLVATLVSCLLIIYMLGAPTAAVFNGMTDWLAGMSNATAVVLGIVIGLMLTYDVGGPVNKVAFLFGVGLLPAGQFLVMGIVSICIAVPSGGQGLATLLRRTLYSDEERELGRASLEMSLFGRSEGAIPFAAADPTRVTPANMIGGAVAGGTAALFGVTNYIPVGGLVAVLLGVVGGVVGFVAALVLGTLVTALLTIGLKSWAGSSGEGLHPRDGAHGSGVSSDR